MAGGLVDPVGLGLDEVSCWWWLIEILLRRWNDDHGLWRWLVEVSDGRWLVDHSLRSLRDEVLLWWGLEVDVGGLDHQDVLGWWLIGVHLGWLLDHHVGWGRLDDILLRWWIVCVPICWFGHEVI